MSFVIDLKQFFVQYDLFSYKKFPFLAKNLNTITMEDLKDGEKLEQ